MLSGRLLVRDQVGGLDPRRVPVVVSTVVLLSLSMCLLVTVVAPTRVSAATTSKTTTSTSKTPALMPTVRAGQPLITPGHGATQGPIGADPAKPRHQADHPQWTAPRRADLQRRLRRIPLRSTTAPPSTPTPPTRRVGRTRKRRTSRSSQSPGRPASPGTIWVTCSPPFPSGRCRAISGRPLYGPVPTGLLSCTTPRPPPTPSTASTRRPTRDVS